MTEATSAIKCAVEAAGDVLREGPAFLSSEDLFDAEELVKKGLQILEAGRLNLPRAWVVGRALEATRDLLREDAGYLTEDRLVEGRFLVKQALRLVANGGPTGREGGSSQGLPARNRPGRRPDERAQSDVPGPRWFSRRLKPAGQ
jgi:hypothetical protein